MLNEQHRDDVASLTEKAYQAISGAIARLDLKPGEAIAQDLLVAAERNDIEAWEKIDHPYHERLLEAAGNLFLRRSIEDVRRRLQRLTYHLAIQPEHLLAGTHEHIALAQAIYDCNAELAAEIMRQHLETMHTMAMRLIRTHIVP